jgi:hypothetical protein
MLVPWIKYSPPPSVNAAAPIGFLGEPPGITRGSDGLSLDFCGLRPGRPEVFAVDPHRARPGPAGLVDTDRVAYRAPVTQHVIELSLARLYHDGAGRIILET